MSKNEFKWRIVNRSRVRKSVKQNKQKIGGSWEWREEKPRCAMFQVHPQQLTQHTANQNNTVYNHKLLPFPTLSRPFLLAVSTLTRGGQRFTIRFHRPPARSSWKPSQRGGKKIGHLQGTRAILSCPNSTTDVVGLLPGCSSPECCQPTSIISIMHPWPA